MKALLRDATALQASALWRAAGGVASALALTHLLGPRNQGDYVVATALAALPWLVLGPGAQAIAVREVARERRLDGEDSGAASLAALAKLQLAVAVVVVSVSLLALPWVAERWLGLERRVGFWAACLACTPLIELPRAVAATAMLAWQRSASLARMEMAQEMLRVTLVVCGALATGDLVGAGLGSLAASVASIPLSLSVWGRVRRRDGVPGPGQAWAARRRGRARGLLAGAWRLGLVRNVGSFGKEVLPPILAAGLASREWAAYLRLAQRLAQAALLFGQGIARAALPVLTQLAEHGDWRRLRRTFFQSTALAGGAVLVAWSGLLLALPWLLEALVPGEYVEPVRAAAIALSPGVVALGIAAPAEAFHVATRTLGAAAWIVLAGIPWLAASMAVAATDAGGVAVARGLSVAMLWGLAHPLYAHAWLRHRTHLSPRIPAREERPRPRETAR